LDVEGDSVTYCGHFRGAIPTERTTEDEMFEEVPSPPGEAEVSEWRDLEEVL